MNNINFGGGFLIEKPKNATIWSNIKKELPRHKCIIENINDKGDKFFSVKSIYDKDLAGLILRQNVKFKFYPDINLKVRMDAYYPEDARKILKEQTNIIESEEQLREYIKKINRPNVALLKKYRWTPEDHIDKTLQLIGVNKSDCKIKIKSGVTYIYNSNDKILAKASPNNTEGINFVYIYPKNIDSFSRRIALSQDGTTYEFSPVQYTKFLEKFMKNVKIDLGRKRPQK